MEKLFTVKVQKFGKVPEGKSLLLSVPLVIEPEDSTTVKRGLLYATVEVKATAEFDCNLVIKIITDTLQNEYFNNPEGTPLQCLEKAIVSLRDKILSLLNDPKTLSSLVVEFNTVVSVLWGNVLYVVQYGNGGSFLMREGKIKPISSVSEGSFSVASGVVKDGDFVVLGSKGFCDKYSSDQLLTLSPSSTEDPSVSAVILKFNLSQRPLKEEPLDLRDPNLQKIKVKRGGNVFSKKTGLIVFVILLGLALLVSIIYTSRKSLQSLQVKTVSSALEKGKQNITDASKFIGTDDAKARELLNENAKLLTEAKGKYNSNDLEKLLAENNAKLDEVNKVKRIDDTVYYDVKIDEKEANPVEIVSAGSGALLISDPSRNKLLKFIVDARKLSIIESTMTIKPKFLSATNAGVSFMGDKAFYDYDSGNDKVSNSGINISVPLDTIISASSYLGNVYAVTENKIVKNSSDWAFDGALKDVVSLTIDGNIYVLTKGGELLKFTSGIKDTNFTLKNLDKGFSSPSQVLTNAEFNNLYVLDKGNKRVVVLSNDGVVVKQILPKEGLNMWDDLKAISVSRDEKTLFVLSGSKVYKIDL